MASRSYLLAKVQEGTDREGIVRIIRELEGLEEVTFAEHVVGPFDLVLTTETAGTLEDLLSRIKKVERVAAVTPLKVDPVLPRERMWKNLQSIPLKK